MVVNLQDAQLSAHSNNYAEQRQGVTHSGFPPARAWSQFQPHAGPKLLQAPPDAACELQSLPHIFQLQPLIVEAGHHARP